MAELKIVTVLTVHYDGKVCLLDEPRQKANPRTAFRDNPFVDGRPIGTDMRQ